MRWLLALLFLLGSCAQKAEYNASNEAAVENTAETEVNATDVNAVDMNAVEMNAADNATEVNAAAGPPPPPPPPPPPAPPMADSVGSEANAGSPADNAAEANATAPVQKGVGAFVEPPPMIVGQWSKVEFLVAPKATGTGDVSEGTLEGEAQGKQLAAPGTVFIAPKMRVTLSSDPNVKITLQSQEVQATGMDKSATWQWNVLPQKAGKHELSAEVQPLDAQGNARDSYTRYVTVNAKATIGQRVKEGTETATGAGDMLTKFFTSWKGAVLALAALIGAVFVLMRVIRNRGSDEEKHDG